MMHRGRENERGVALVTTLMIVAAMSAVAVGLSAAVLSSTNRAKSLDASAQADWLAHSAGDYASLILGDVVTPLEGRLVAGMEGLGEPMAFQAEGGLITIVVTDASNCLNINAVRGQSAARQRGASGGARAGSEQSPSDDLRALISAVAGDVTRSESLVASITDWIDRDQSPGLSGAEDSFYMSPGLNYRTSGQPLQDVSELLSVRYMSADLLEALEPMICAYPEDAQHALNINTLTEAEAPLLSIAFSGALDEARARDVLFQRPPGGWATTEDFFALPEIAEISPELRRERRISLTSRYISVRAAIEYRGTRRVLDFIYEIEGAAPVKQIYRERKG
ncbi:MAG: type II secretion system minor pseudopilin GspK [Henriciella sp.]|uniref:type II secretion system minor pseudopilin GspK n=1 Tax=Henriciella sp. TaxID=1968823 RepID=UPI003C7316BE